LIDTEIKKLTDEQYQRAIEIIQSNKEKLEKLADQLLEKEVIFKEDLEAIFGQRPFDDSHILGISETAKVTEEAKSEEVVEAVISSEEPNA
jgi:hypothetical protein